MDSDMIMLELTEKMDKAIESLEKRFTTVRAGRANPSSLDGIVVDYYGSMTPLKQLATISVPEARQLLIKPFDKSCLSAIEKAILTSNLGSQYILEGINDKGEISLEARDEVDKLLKMSFKPEFLNRLDEIIFYKPLKKTLLLALLLL